MHWASYAHTTKAPHDSYSGVSEYINKEFPGTESKSETEALLRKAMADYEEKQFVAKNENITLGDLLDKWLEEEVRPGQLSNGTLSSYQAVIKRIKKHPISSRKLKKLTPYHLQSYLDLLSLGGENLMERLQSR